MPKSPKREGKKGKNTIAAIMNGNELFGRSEVRRSLLGMWVLQLDESWCYDTRSAALAKLRKIKQVLKEG